MSYKASNRTNAVCEKRMIKIMIGAIIHVGYAEKCGHCGELHYKQFVDQSEKIRELTSLDELHKAYEFDRTKIMYYLERVTRENIQHRVFCNREKAKLALH